MRFEELKLAHRSHIAEFIFYKPLFNFIYLIQIRMAKKRKIQQSTKSSGLKITHPDTAGIDVGKDLMQVSVPSERCEQSNRCFKTFTINLTEIVNWLQQCGIKRVVMESTGVYWINIFLMLQEAGIEALLVNAKEVKNLAGRKTDVSDADWLRFLGSCDLIKPCYQVEAISRRLREYSRLRNVKVRDMAREINRMQKAMEQMNIKLGSVISDIDGVSGMAIIHSILEGERDAKTLASLADKRCKKSKEEIALALEGTWNPEHLFSLSQSLETYKFLKKQIEECDTEMKKFIDSYGLESTVNKPIDSLPRSQKQVCRKNKINFDVEEYAYRMFGVNLMKIPGVSHATLLTLMSELGPRFTEKFPSASKFSRWCNLTPIDKVTGGELKSTNVPKRKNLVGQAFRQCATTLQKKDVPLSHFYRRIKSRSGGAQAIVATAHKIAEIVYFMVRRQEEYHEEITARNETEILEQKLAILVKRQHYLKNQIDKLGKANNAEM